MQQSRVAIVVLTIIAALALGSMAAGLYHAAGPRPQKPQITVVQAKPIDAQREQFLRTITTLREKLDGVEKERDHAREKLRQTIADLATAQNALDDIRRAQAWSIMVRPEASVVVRRPLK